MEIEREIWTEKERERERSPETLGELRDGGITPQIVEGSGAIGENLRKFN